LCYSFESRKLKLYVWGGQSCEGEKYGEDSGGRFVILEEKASLGLDSGGESKTSHDSGGESKSWS
jgi:hypothetical protein